MVYTVPILERKKSLLGTVLLDSRSSQRVLSRPDEHSAVSEGAGESLPQLEPWIRHLASRLGQFT